MWHFYLVFDSEPWMFQAMGEYQRIIVNNSFFFYLHLLPLFSLSSLFLLTHKFVLNAWKQDLLYMDNLEASIVVLRKLSDEWKHIVKHDTLHPFTETLKSFSQKVNNFLFCNESYMTWWFEEKKFQLYAAFYANLHNCSMQIEALSILQIVSFSTTKWG